MPRIGTMSRIGPLVGTDKGVPAERQERLALHEYGGVQHYRLIRTVCDHLLRLQVLFRSPEPLVPDGVLAVEHSVEPAHAYRWRKG
jgi:hypothetical protein